MDAVFGWLHIAAAVVWLGGLAFLVFGLPIKPAEGSALGPAAFVQASKRFQPFFWLAMVLLVGSGVYRIVELGGMRAVPVIIHIKITIALVMILLSLVNSFYMLPRLEKQQETGDLAGSGLLRNYSLIYVVVMVLGFVVFGLLSAGQYFFR